TAVPDNRGVAIWISGWCFHQKMIFWVDRVFMWKQLCYQRCPGFSIFRKLACRQEESGCSIPQNIMIVNFVTTQFRHGYGFHFRRSCFSTAQQFSSVVTALVGTTKIFSKTSRFQLHVVAAFITLNNRPFVSLDFKNPFFYGIPRAI